MSAELVQAGETVPIRVLMYDGSTAKTGLTVLISIERISDGRYWDGNAWQVAYGTLSMSELSGDAHLDGIYQYSFVTPAAVDRYDWRVTYNGASFDRAFAGRIATTLLAVNATQIEGTDPTDQINAACDVALSDYGANTTTPPTVGAIADQVWDEPVAEHVAASTFGNYMSAAKNDVRGLAERIGLFSSFGQNTLLDYVEALMRSDATTPPNLGGSYAASTDSLEAIRDRGDAEWTSGSGGSGFEV